MTDYQPDSGYAAIAQVDAYWEALRGTRIVPKRSEIDPRGIEGALEYAFILERIAPGIARLRIAGSHLNALMGMEVRGMPLTALFSTDARAIVAETLEEVFQTPGTAAFDLTAPPGPGRPAGNARMLLLPLKSDLGDISRLLGCLVYRGEIGRGPRRMDIASRRFTPLMPGSDAIPPAPPPDVPVTRPPVAGFAAPETAFEGKGPDVRHHGARRPPYLRLVKSDD